MRTNKFSILAQVLMSACNANGILRTGDAATDTLVDELAPVRKAPYTEPRLNLVPTYSMYEPQPRVVNSNKKPSKRATNAAKRKAKKTSQKRNRK